MTSPDVGGALRVYRRLEARHAPWRAGWISLLAGVFAVIGCQWMIPRLPAPAIDLMRLGFRLPDMTAIVLFNDYAAVYFFAFFAGLIGMLGVVAVPREERRLELLLAKPVPTPALVAARTWPVLVITTITGLGISAASAASAWSLGGAGATPTAAFGAGAMMTAAVVLELAALGVALVRTTEAMYAVFLALLVAILPLMPTAVFLYRPDAFDGHTALTTVVVVASLVWNGATLVWLGPLALVLALVVAAGLIRVAGRGLARAGV